MVQKTSATGGVQERTNHLPIEKTALTKSRKPPRKMQTWSPEEDELLRFMVARSRRNDKRDTIDWLETRQALSWRTPDEIRGRWRRMCLAALIDEENQCPGKEYALAKLTNTPTRDVTVRLNGAGSVTAVTEAAEVPAPPKDANAFPGLHPYVVWGTPPLRKIDIRPIVPMTTPWIEDIDLEDPIFA